MRGPLRHYFAVCIVILIIARCGLIYVIHIHVEMNLIEFLIIFILETEGGA